jgi:hypothetical protein
MAVLSTVRFSDNSVAWIEGHETVMFMCKNDESWSFDGVYFIPRLMTNIVSVSQLDEIGYNIDIDTDMMKIREPGGVMLAKVKREVNRLYLLHLTFAHPTCLAVRGHGEEVAWRWHERFRHVNMAALQKMAQEELVHGLPKIGQVGHLWEVMTHFIPGEGGVLSGMTSGASAWQLVRSNLTGNAKRVTSTFCCLWMILAGTCG